MSWLSKKIRTVKMLNSARKEWKEANAEAKEIEKETGGLLPMAQVPTYQGEDNRTYIQPDPAKSAKKAGKDGVELLLAAGAGSVAAWLTTKTGFEIDPTWVIAGVGLVAKLALRFMFDMGKERPARTLP